MKNQWTTVDDAVPAEQAGAAQNAAQNPGKEPGNRKMALAMASVGVFLILIGAAPFLFGDDDPQDYSAFLGQEVSTNSGAQIALEEDEESMDDSEAVMIDDPEAIEVDIPEAPASEQEPEEPAPEDEPATDNMPDPPAQEVPSEEPELENTPEPETPAPIKVPAKPAITPDPESQPGPRDGSEEEPEATIISELVDYPIITGSTETDPKDLARIATSQQMHAAAPEQPGTGLPALPLLAFSGAAAYFWRKKRNRS